MYGFLEVETPDEQTALALVDALHGLDAELIPLASGRCAVGVELARDARAETVVIRVVGIVERWLVDCGVESATVRLAKRSYTLAADLAHPRLPLAARPGAAAA
jgi:hypothetical protein